MTWWGGCARELAGQVPAGWTPHWFRHSHATALLLAGVPVHVVSRRLGHADVQTTLNIYAHVTEDAELRAVADWKALTAGGWPPSPTRPGDRAALVSGARPTPALARGCGRQLSARDPAGPVGGGPARDALWPISARARRRRSTAAGWFTGAGGPRGLTCRGCPRRCARSWRGACSASSTRAARSTSPTCGRWCAASASVIGDLGRGRACLADWTWRRADWQQQIALAVRRRTGAAARARQRQATCASSCGRCYRLLAAAYDARPWWQREVWDPAADPRIPQRAHEPRGAHCVHFDQHQHRLAAPRAAVALQGRPGNRRPWRGARSSCGSTR